MDASIQPSELIVVRELYLAEKIVMVDGQAGCGKTLISPLVASFDRVELLTYAYELEHICWLHFLNKVTTDAAVAMSRMWTDLQLYNSMMAREVNFRLTDMSSVFQDVRPWRYLRRIFSEGDEAVPGRVKNERPILHLTTHNLLGASDPVFEALGDRLVFIEVVRHPLYTLKQSSLNMERVMHDSRHFTIYYRRGSEAVPVWAYGWEQRFIDSNPMEKAIYVVDHLSRLTESKKMALKQKYKARIVTIPFERFVIEPDRYLQEVCVFLSTRVTTATRAVMKRQKVPRAKIADGLGLKIYKRCGWVGPQKGADELKEYELRWRHAAQSASRQALTVLDRLCTEYEQTYLGGCLPYQRPL